MKEDKYNVREYLGLLDGGFEDENLQYVKKVQTSEMSMKDIDENPCDIDDGDYELYEDSTSGKKYVIHDYCGDEEFIYIVKG